MEVKYDTKHHAGATPEARIANRLKPSAGDDCGDVQVTKGTGPTRTVTSIHHSGHQQHAKHSADERREAAPHATMRKEMDSNEDR